MAPWRPQIVVGPAPSPPNSESLRQLGREGVEEHQETGLKAFFQADVLTQGMIGA